MALKINSARNSLLQSLDKSKQSLADSLQRLGTGRSINKAADNSAGLLLADLLASQASGIGQSIRNASDALAMLVAEAGGMAPEHTVLDCGFGFADQPLDRERISCVESATWFEFNLLMHVR